MTLPVSPPNVSTSAAAIDESLAAVIRGRRTIGSFRAEIPPREIVLEALELARWAPNHKKTEPWKVCWLGPESIRAVIDLNAQILLQTKGQAEADAKSKKWAQTPGWLVITCELDDDLFRREEDYAACCCWIQNLQLALWSSGVGTKWSTGAVTWDPKFYELLEIDALKTRVVGMVWYGYPAVIPDQTRKPVASFLRELP